MPRRWTLGQIEKLARANEDALGEGAFRIGPDVLGIDVAGRSPQPLTQPRRGGLLDRIREHRNHKED